MFKTSSRCGDSRSGRTALLQAGFDSLPDSMDFPGTTVPPVLNDCLAKVLGLRHGAVIPNPASKAQSHLVATRFNLLADLRIEIPLVDANQRRDSEVPGEFRDPLQIMESTQCGLGNNQNQRRTGN